MTSVPTKWLPASGYFKSIEHNHYFWANSPIKQFKLDIMPDGHNSWLRFTVRKEHYQVDINKWGKDISDSSHHLVTGASKENLKNWFKRSFKREWQEEFGLWSKRQ